MKTRITFFLALLHSCLLNAQADRPEMADALRQDGKFWVVVICLLIILLGLLTWVFMLDRKVSKMEKEKK